MYIGFAIHHVARKILFGSAIAGCLGLATKQGQRIARIGFATLKGAVEAGVREARIQSRA